MKSNWVKIIDEHFIIILIMYILYMKNSKFIIDKLGKLFEQGIISSKDLSSELFNILNLKEMKSFLR